MKRLKLTRWKGKKPKQNETKRQNYRLPNFGLFLFFSPQIANNLVEHHPSNAIQVANEISQFQELNNNGIQSDETSNRIIKTSDLISWSLQIARGMEFLASKKVTQF